MKEKYLVNARLIDPKNDMDIVGGLIINEKGFKKPQEEEGAFKTLLTEKIISEANIINYDYIADSYSLSFSKGFHLNK